MGYIWEKRQEFFALTAHGAPRWASPRSARWGVWHGEGGEAVQHGLVASAGGVVLGGLLVVLAT